MKVALTVLLLLFQFYIGKCDKTTDSLLTVLKSEINRKQLYNRTKESRIKELKKRLETNSSNELNVQYQLCSKIYDEYKDYKFDSAYVYSQKLLHISNLTNDIIKLYESKLKLGAIQLSGGMFKETFDCIRQINVHLVQDSIKLKYYILKSRALHDLALYNTDEFYSPANHAESVKMLDSALYLTQPGTYDQHKLVAQKLILSGKKLQAAGILNKLLLNKTLTPHQRAMAASDLSHLVSDPEKIKLITLAAIYDIRSSTMQTRACFTLGTIFFKKGSIDNAGLFLKEALAQASFYGNKPREREISAILTQVSAQQLINSGNEKNRVLTILIAFFGISIVGIALFSYAVYSRLKQVRIREAIIQQQNRHLDDMNKKLLEDAHIKEEYIGYFFSTISGYILKLERVKWSIIRQIKAKSYEELLNQADEIDIKEERENLFYTFDKIFLKLFPDFITVFNSLFKPEDQIWPKANEVLNTQLRIFALKRLGINDNQTIAGILESAVSTIYKYKLRIKSKALLQGNDFDKKIMEIESRYKFPEGNH